MILSSKEDAEDEDLSGGFIDAEIEHSPVLGDVPQPVKNVGDEGALKGQGGKSVDVVLNAEETLFRTVERVGNGIAQGLIAGNKVIEDGFQIRAAVCAAPNVKDHGRRACERSSPRSCRGFPAPR